MVTLRPDRGSVKEERWRKCKKKEQVGERERDDGKRENKNKKAGKIEKKQA